MNLTVLQTGLRSNARSVSGTNTRALAGGQLVKGSMKREVLRSCARSRCVCEHGKVATHSSTIFNQIFFAGCACKQSEFEKTEFHFFGKKLDLTFVQTGLPHMHTLASSQAPVGGQQCLLGARYSKTYCKRALAQGVHVSRATCAKKLGLVFCHKV